MQVAQDTVVFLHYELLDSKVEAVSAATEEEITHGHVHGAHGHHH